MKNIFKTKLFLLCSFIYIFLTVFSCKEENIKSVFKESIEKKVTVSNISAHNKDNKKKEIVSEPILKNNVHRLIKFNEKNNNLVGSNTLSEDKLVSKSITVSNLQEKKRCVENTIEDTQEKIMGNSLNVQQKDDLNKKLIQIEENINNEFSSDNNSLTSSGYSQSTSIYQEYEELDSIISSGYDSIYKSSGSDLYETKIKEDILLENKKLIGDLSDRYSELYKIFLNLFDNENMLIHDELYSDLKHLYESYKFSEDKIIDYLDVENSNDNRSEISRYCIEICYNNNSKQIIDVFNIHLLIRNCIIDSRNFIKKYYDKTYTYEYKDENSNNEECINELESLEEKQKETLYQTLRVIKYLEYICSNVVPSDNFDIITL